MELVMEYLPWIIALAAAWLIIGVLLKLARAVISIGCSLIVVAVVVVILVNLF